MLLRVDSSDSAPLYRQLMEQVAHAVETGGLRPGERLPPIREAAGTAGVDPNTVARAYRELRQVGLVAVRHGAGAFVADGLPAPGEGLREARAILEEAVRRARELGVSDAAIRRLVEGGIGAGRGA